MTVRVQYSSNNSGGSWWLDDEDWRALEEAGWKVGWYIDSGMRMVTEEGRFLGALAADASKEFPSLREGIAEWESITGQDSYEEGCECCGPPHGFYSEEIK
jgi:hypothetical protein